MHTNNPDRVFGCCCFHWIINTSTSILIRMKTRIKNVECASRMYKMSEWMSGRFFSYCYILKKCLTIFRIQFLRLNIVNWILCYWFLFFFCIVSFRPYFFFAAFADFFRHMHSIFTTTYFLSLTLSCLCYFFASTVKRITSFFTRDMSHALVYVYPYVYFFAPGTYYLTNAKRLRHKCFFLSIFSY